MRESFLISFICAVVAAVVPSAQETQPTPGYSPAGSHGQGFQTVVNQCDQAGPLEIQTADLFESKPTTQVETPPAPTPPQCKNGTCPDGYSCENGFCKKKAAQTQPTQRQGVQRSVVTKRSQCCQSEPKRQGFFARLRQGTHCRKTCRRR